MGILYLDEAGNTGLRDTDQPLLIYGGPYVEPSSWKMLSHDLSLIHRKYLGIIVGRFQSGLGNKNFLTEVGMNVNFLTDFHFHAKNIINRKALWSKLNKTERFVVLEDIVDLVIKYDIPFYVGALDKKKYSSKKKRGKGKLSEYRHLHNIFLPFVENDLRKHAHVVTVIDDGDPGEIKTLKSSLNEDELKKFFGELVRGKHRNYPLLQVADVGIWIFQAYHRLSNNRNDDYAKNIKRLYYKLHNVLRIITC